jgi:hypothetical protein
MTAAATGSSTGRRTRVPWVVISPLLVGALSLAVWFAVGGIEDDIFIVVMLWLAPLFAFLAATIATRVPGNAIAWLLLTVGLSIPVAGLVSLAIPAEAPTEPSFLLGVALLVVEASWMAFIFPILLVLFLFPTGSFLNRRWRWAGWLVVAMLATFTFLSLFVTEWTSATAEWTVVNPIGFIPAAVFAGPLFEPLWSSGLVVLAIGGLISIVLRYRRSTATGRAQIKWFVVPAAAFALFYGLSAITGGDAWVSTTLFSVGFGVTFASLPVAMTIAITRYRLYEIDRIVSRTILYGIVLALMVGVYAGALLAVGLVVPAHGDLQVAIATLVAVGVSIPAGRRIRRRVDRRFFRSRYDAAQVVSSFAAELRHTINTDAVVALTVSVVAGAFAPEVVDVWLDGGSM